MSRKTRVDLFTILFLILSWYLMHLISLWFLQRALSRKDHWVAMWCCKQVVPGMPYDPIHETAYLVDEFGNRQKIREGDYFTYKTPFGNPIRVVGVLRGWKFKKEKK